jgi:hypothetical protein
MAISINLDFEEAQKFLWLGLWIAKSLINVCHSYIYLSKPSRWYLLSHVVFCPDSPLIAMCAISETTVLTAYRDL